MYWDSPNNNKAQSTYQMCHLIKISHVEELNKTSLFNGSIIKTCVGKKKHVVMVATIKQRSELPGMISYILQCHRHPGLGLALTIQR